MKRPLSAFMLYCNHRRPQIRAERPGNENFNIGNIEILFTEISKQAGEEWKGFTVE
jgi:hypothetical protein